MNSIQELRTKKAKLYHQAKDVREVAKKEGRSLTAEEVGKVETILEDMKVVQREISTEEELRSMAAEYAERQEVIDKIPQAQKQAKAFDKYLRYGIQNLSREERSLLGSRRDSSKVSYRGTDPQTTSPDSAGGFLVPEGWSGELNFAKQFIGEVENVARPYRTNTGAKIPFPKTDDTSNEAEQQTEGSAVTVVDMTIGNTDVEAYTYATLVKVSDQLLLDEDVNLPMYLDILLKDRIARKSNSDLTTGNGTGKPNGIITAATVGKTAAATNAITDEELMDLFFSVDPAYRKSDRTCFMANDSVHSIIMKSQLIASENFSPVRINDTGDLFIMGKPVKVNQDMVASLTANAKPLIFGDFNEYIVRSVNGFFMKRLNERYAEELNVGFLFYRRLDGELISGGTPLKVLQMAAS